MQTGNIRARVLASFVQGLAATTIMSMVTMVDVVDGLTRRVVVT
jgi:hypothetical protein